MCLLLALCVAVSYFNAEAVFLKASAHSPDGAVRLRLLAVGRDAAGSSGSVPAAAPGAQGCRPGTVRPCSHPCWGAACCICCWQSPRRVRPCLPCGRRGRPLPAAACCAAAWQSWARRT